MIRPRFHLLLALITLVAPSHAARAQAPVRTPAQSPAKTPPVASVAPPGKVVATAGAAAATNDTASAPPAAARHPWGTFPKGAWKRVRVVTETIDGRGKVLSTSVTETTSTLEQVGERDFSLRVESKVEIGGRQFHAQPQVVRQGYFGEPAGQAATIRKTADGELTINGLVIPCETREVAINGDATRRLTVMQVSDKVSPYVLKSITTAANGEGKSPVAGVMVEVVALSMPYKVLSETKSTSFVKTIHVRDDGRTTTTLEVHCPEVPGGVVAHTSQETDAQGQVIQRSTLELLAYGSNDSSLPVRRRLFHRSRGRGAGQGGAAESSRP